MEMSGSRNNRPERGHKLHSLTEMLNPKTREPVFSEVICHKCGEKFQAMDLGRFTRIYCYACVEKLRLEEDLRESAEALLVQQKAQRERLMRARIPVDWQLKTFENSNPKIHPGAFQACQNYATQFSVSSPSLIIFSDIFGSGKTHLAICITNYLLHQRHLDVRFIKARDILLEIKTTFDKGSKEGEDTVLSRLMNFPLLVIDDLGVDSPTEWTMSTFWSVFDRRIESHMPVVVTTNYSPEDDGPLGDRIGMGSLSRLRGMCGDNIIAFKGKDLRRNK